MLCPIVIWFLILSRHRGSWTLSQPLFRASQRWPGLHLATSYDLLNCLRCIFAKCAPRALSADIPYFKGSGVIYFITDCQDHVSEVWSSQCDCWEYKSCGDRKPAAVHHFGICRTWWWHLGLALALTSSVVFHRYLKLLMKVIRAILFLYSLDPAQ